MFQWDKSETTGTKAINARFKDSCLLHSDLFRISDFGLSAQQADLLYPQYPLSLLVVEKRQRSVHRFVQAALGFDLLEQVLVLFDGESGTKF
jgi:hypothetical protein